MGFTNRGVYTMLSYCFRNGTRPTNYYIGLVTDSSVATTVNTFSDLTEIAAGNGYTAGGYSLTPGATDFDVLTEDDGNNRAYIQLKDIVWTASGGSIPGSGSGALNAILTDDNATQGSRIVFNGWSLTSARTVSDGQTLTLTNCEMRLATA